MSKQPQCDPSPPTNTLVLQWCGFVAAGLLLAWISGRISAHHVSDSPSYLNYSFESLESVCRSIRTFAYPLWLKILQPTIGLSRVPIAQVIVHASACFWLMRSLIRWKLPFSQALAAAIAVGVGCTAMDHINTISTDAMSASVGVMVACALMDWARETTWKSASWIMALATTLVFLRPAYLFIVPWLVIAGSMLLRVTGHPWKRAFGSSLLLGTALCLPLVSWIGLRYAVVGDAGFLPFGHQNLSGILVQLVSDDELIEIDSELGSAILEEKSDFDQRVGFAKGQPGATMTIDSRWDDMTYHVVIPASEKVAGEDVVKSHLALKDLNTKLIRRYPQRYAVWLAKAIRRGAWSIAADIVMHPIFLPCIALMILATVIRAITAGASLPKPNVNDGLRALTIIAFSYMAFSLSFTVLTSPAIGRFGDASAIFLPAWFAVVFHRWWETGN